MTSMLLLGHGGKLVRKQYTSTKFWITTRYLSSSNATQQRAWTSQAIRTNFIDYFKQRDHLYVHSSSVIPKKNEGTYFVNAGMNQFKPIFTGQVDPNSAMASYQRVVNSQKCIRVGGKHNDLDDVGKDTSHHTFFEMLGSWSFGDYFKKEACVMGWDLLTNVYNLPPDRLYVTYYQGNAKLGLDPDLECRQIWKDIGVPDAHILPFGESDNFWDMGETGPCGPCTEIHYEHPTVKKNKNVAAMVNAGCPDVMEIWNLVFMQFDRQLDGSLLPLTGHYVDTGMGLERITAVLQNTTSNYNTDLFLPLFEHIQQHSTVGPYKGRFPPKAGHDIDTAYRIIADHARMCTVAISDGIVPGRGNRSTKLRHIIYRAIRQAKDVLGAPPGLVAELVPVVIESLGDAFPELQENMSGVCDVINQTEERYLIGCQAGTKMLHKALNQNRPTNVLSGDQIHEILEGRYGNPLPLDILEDVAAQQGIVLDIVSYDALIDSIQQSHIETVIQKPHIDLTLTQHDLAILQQHNVPISDDSYKYDYSMKKGKYEFPSVCGQIVSIFTGEAFVSSLTTNCDNMLGLLLNKTNFYAEKGGQVADTGYITNDQGLSFRVTDVQEFQQYVLHIGVLEKGTASVKDDVITHIDQTSVSGDDLSAIENALSQSVSAHLPVMKQEVPLDRAKMVNGLCWMKDAIYPESVQVISVGYPIGKLLANPHSGAGRRHAVELCGGTHLDNTEHLGAIVITNFTGSQQGVKKVTAIAGEQAVQSQKEARELEMKVEKLSGWIKTQSNQDLWVKEAYAIERGISEGNHLPKLSRDKITQSLIPLMEQVNKLKNTSVKEFYRQRLQSMQVPGQPLIAQFPFKKARDMVAVLASSEVSDPTMLISDHVEKKLGGRLQYQAVCMLPQNVGTSARLWAGHISSQMDGYARPPKGKHAKHNNIYVLTFLTSKHKGLDHSMMLAKTYIDLYT